MIKLANNLLSWCPDAEEACKVQALSLAEHPCLATNVCLMPDAHAGYGMPIGGVAALDHAVCPNMVGVDIGCSMTAVQTNIRPSDLESTDLQNIVNSIKNKIPVGFKHHQAPITHEIFEDKARWASCFIASQQYDSAQLQLGTLGGGNHFIEIQSGSDGFIWFMIHSGSRNLGYQVARHYNWVAETFCTQWRQHKVVLDELAFLPYGSEAYEDYIREMKLCMDFAQANHDVMRKRIQEAFQENLGLLPYVVEFTDKIYTRHNYARLENVHNRNLIVHRKGAISAREDERAVIPGSQGTSSYIVRGLGNPASLYSASHGSGRKMSRKAARENLFLEHEQELMRGIIHDITTEESLEEAPSAYKDIQEVMDNQKDLVESLVELRPLAVVKG
jgi:tRNA-splicing ligase RtcB